MSMVMTLDLYAPDDDRLYNASAQKITDEQQEIHNAKPKAKLAHPRAKLQNPQMNGPTMFLGQTFSPFSVFLG